MGRCEGGDIFSLATSCIFLAIFSMLLKTLLIRLRVICGTAESRVIVFIQCLLCTLVFWLVSSLQFDESPPLSYSSGSIVQLTSKTISCPFCSLLVESSSHLFVTCEVASSIWVVLPFVLEVCGPKPGGWRIIVVFSSLCFYVVVLCHFSRELYSLCLIFSTCSLYWPLVSPFFSFIYW